MSQSVDEDDVVLKDLVSKTLQNNGVLGKIQAQLRASVFLALEDEFKDRSVPLCSEHTKQLLASPAGSFAASLIHDFFTCLGLDFSLSVYGPESNLGAGLWQLHTRGALLANLGLGQDAEPMTPVLYSYCKKHRFTDNINGSSGLITNNEADALHMPVTSATKDAPVKNGSSSTISRKNVDNSNKTSITETSSIKHANSNSTSTVVNNSDIATASTNKANAGTTIDSKQNTPVTNLSSTKPSSLNKVHNNNAVTVDTNSVPTRPNSFSKATNSTSASQTAAPRAVSSSNNMMTSADTGGEAGVVPSAPPGNILSAPPVTDDWEDSSDSSYQGGPANTRNLIKSLVNEVNQDTARGGRRSLHTDSSSSSTVTSKGEDEESLQQYTQGAEQDYEESFASSGSSSTGSGSKTEQPPPPAAGGAAAGPNAAGGGTRQEDNNTTEHSEASEGVQTDEEGYLDEILDTDSMSDKDKTEDVTASDTTLTPDYHEEV